MSGNLEAIRAVLEDESLVLVESHSRPGLLQAVPDCILSKGPQYSNSALRALLDAGFGSRENADRVLAEAPVEVVLWLQDCFTAGQRRDYRIPDLACPRPPCRSGAGMIGPQMRDQEETPFRIRSVGELLPEFFEDIARSALFPETAAAAREAAESFWQRGREGGACLKATERYEYAPVP
jgi:hypothetical protein